MTAQFFTTPGGEEMAVLPRSELNALIEELEDWIDNEAGAKAAAAYARGEIEAFPGELVSALIDGANPVRSFREHRGLAPPELAERAGLTIAALAEIECGAVDATGSVYSKLAAALGVDVDLLLWS